MSASSSEDEINEALKESANCDYINDLVKPSKTKENVPQKSIRNATSDRSAQDDVVRENDFEKFLAQRLAGRLDESIKIVEGKERDVGIESSSGGIRLFTGSPVVSELEEDVEVEPRKRMKLSKTTVDYEGRAVAAAVSPDWVKDVTNISHWKDSKKPRVLEATVVKKYPNGGIECSPTA
uniref:Uncharacterized protein n=1 Tax=Lygus hesperus TaxID=30085 RepID=A0A146KRG7_LYGHE